MLSQKTFLIMSVLATMLFATAAQAQLRVATYNVAQRRGDDAALQNVIAEIQQDDSEGWTVPVAVFCFQEVRDEDVTPIGSAIALTAPPGTSYQLATYTNFGENGVAGAQLCYYDANLLTEDVSEHDDIFTGAGRYTDRWRFTMDGYTSPDASFYIYSGHMKAGSSGSDEDIRVDGITDLRANFSSLPAGSHILFVGDMNFSSHTDDSYELTVAPAASPAQMYDPLGTGSWTGSGNAIKHSQSPRNITSGGLIGGSLDDRFDFIFHNVNFNDSDGLSHMSTSSYRSLGNDGQHYDTAINSGNNFYFPGNLARSNALADDLFDGSDHIPVITEFRIPAVLIAATTSNLGKVIQGGAVPIDVTVLNFADVVISDGADVLQYTADGTGDVFGSASGNVTALTAGDTNPFFVFVTDIGPINGGIDFDALNEAAANLTPTINITGDVVRHSNGSFDNVADINTTTVAMNLDADTGVQPLHLPIYNLGYDADQAFLDVKNTIGFGAPFSLGGPFPTDIDDLGSNIPFQIDTTGLAPGLHELEFDLLVGDEDIPGASTAIMTVTLSVTIDGKGNPCDEDVNGDGSVNIEDLLAILATWGTCGSCPEDITGDGDVAIEDLLAVLAAWGPC